MLLVVMTAAVIVEALVTGRALRLQALARGRLLGEGVVGPSLHCEGGSH
jgi:hypothetical protein